MQNYGFLIKRPNFPAFFVFPLQDQEPNDPARCTPFCQTGDKGEDTSFKKLACCGKKCARTQQNVLAHTFKLTWVNNEGVFRENWRKNDTAYGFSPYLCIVKRTQRDIFNREKRYEVLVKVKEIEKEKEKAIESSSVGKVSTRLGKDLFQDSRY